MGRNPHFVRSASSAGLTLSGESQISGRGESSHWVLGPKSIMYLGRGLPLKKTKGWREVIGQGKRQCTTYLNNVVVGQLSEQLYRLYQTTRYIQAQPDERTCLIPSIYTLSNLDMQIPQYGVRTARPSRGSLDMELCPSSLRRRFKTCVSDQRL